MKLLFIHQNFPGQYLRLARHMRDSGHEVTGLGETRNITTRGILKGITTLGYSTPGEAGSQTHHYLRTTEAAIRRAQTVARSLLAISAKGFVPDVICLHPGWGEGLFVRDVFPRAPILMFCEFYFRAHEADLSFDPEFAHSQDWTFSVRIRNTAQVMSLLTANACISPSVWQASRYPDCFRSNMHIVHEGIDTHYMSPNEAETLAIQPLRRPGESRVAEEPPSNAAKGAPPEPPPYGAPLTLSRKDKIITYVSRNLEPYRGAHIFLRALPLVLQRHPDAHILIVGRNGTSYSPQLPGGQTYKANYLKELQGKLDLSRIHFLGQVSYNALRRLFRITSAHVYLTYPFVLSWSFLEAMACEGLVIGSRTAPVEEVVTHEKNGLLVDFFDKQALADTIDRVLTTPRQFIGLRKEARKTIIERFHLQTCLQQQTTLLRDLASGCYPTPR